VHSANLALNGVLRRLAHERCRAPLKTLQQFAEELISLRTTPLLHPSWHPNPRRGSAPKRWISCFENRSNVAQTPLKCPWPKTIPKAPEPEGAKREVAKVWAIYVPDASNTRTDGLIRRGGQAGGLYQQLVFLNLSLTGPLHKGGTKTCTSTHRCVAMIMPRCPERVKRECWSRQF
jgi:hypothetical protein